MNFLLEHTITENWIKTNLFLQQENKVTRHGTKNDWAKKKNRWNKVRGHRYPFTSSLISPYINQSSNKPDGLSALPTALNYCNYTFSALWNSTLNCFKLERSNLLREYFLFEVQHCLENFDYSEQRRLTTGLPKGGHLLKRKSSIKGANNSMVSPLPATQMLKMYNEWSRKQHPWTLQQPALQPYVNLTGLCRNRPRIQS